MNGAERLISNERVKSRGLRSKVSVEYHKAANENLHHHPPNKLKEEWYADSPSGRQHLG